MDTYDCSVDQCALEEDLIGRVLCDCFDESVVVTSVDYLGEWPAIGEDCGVCFWFAKCP
jgi:hypothetical protein